MFRMYKKSVQTFLPFCYNPRVWQRDRQADGRTAFSISHR